MNLTGILKWIVAKVMPILKRMGVGPEKSYDMISPSLPSLGQNDFVAAYREDDVIRQKSEQLQRQIVDNLFDINYMVESDMPRGRRYMIQYRFEVYDRETGKTSVEYRNVYEMDRNTLRGWLESGKNYFEAIYQRYNMELVSASVHNVFHKAGWHY